MRDEKSFDRAALARRVWNQALCCVRLPASRKLGEEMPGPLDRNGVTRLLRAWEIGDQHALERLNPLICNELRRIARRYMARERPGHTPQATALVSEAYLRLVDAEEGADRRAAG